MGNEKFKVIILPTEKAEDSIVISAGKAWHFKGYFTQDYLNSQDKKSNYLYIISDDEIKEGDWVVCDYLNKKYVIGKILRSAPPDEGGPAWFVKYLITDTEEPWEGYCLKKIVATTDTDLRHLFGVKEGGCAAISESFVQEYIKSYNDGRIITEVELAISRNKYPDLHGNFYDINIGSDNTVLVLSHNQTIDVEPIKINEDNVDYLKATIKDREVLIGQLDYKRKELQESSDRGLTETAELRKEIKNLAESLQEMVNEFNVVTDARNEIEQEEAMNNAIELLSKYKKD